MSDQIVCRLLKRLANNALEYRESELAESLDQLVGLGVLRQTESASSVACEGCGVLLGVSYLRDEATGKLHGYIACSECGIDEVSASELRRWSIDVPGLIRAIFASASDLKLAPKPVVPECLWSLARATWGDRSQEVFLVTRYRSSDYEAMGQAMHRRPKTLLLFPTEAAVTRWNHSTENPILALESMLRLGEIGFELDVATIQVALRIPDSKPTRKPTRRREARMANIKLLERALRDHLRAARDHAVSNRDHTGVPQLLQRPLQEELGKQVGLEPYSVTRCMRDKDAEILRYLWEMAGDLDAVLGYRR